MSASTVTRAAFGAAILIGIAADMATAQTGFLRRVQDRVTEAVEQTVGSGSQAEQAPASTTTATAAAPAGEAASQPQAPRNDPQPRVLAMDGAVMTRFDRALTAEIAARDGWVAFEKEFVACQGRMYTDPSISEEMVGLTEAFSRAMETAASTDDIVRAGEQYQAQTDAVVAKHCGISQTAFVERQGNVNAEVMQAALAAGEMTEAQYAMLKERIVPFCVAGGSADRIAGPEGDDFYVYTAEEVAAVAPLCASLMPKVERTI